MMLVNSVRISLVANARFENWQRVRALVTATSPNLPAKKDVSLEAKRSAQNSSKSSLDLKIQSAPKRPISSSNEAEDLLRQIIIETIQSIGVGDVRSLKTLINAWVNWVSQMLKLHGIDHAQAAMQPIVNIGILSDLPDVRR